MKPGKAESLISYLLAFGLAALIVVSVILTEENSWHCNLLKVGVHLGVLFSQSQVTRYGFACPYMYCTSTDIAPIELI